MFEFNVETVPSGMYEVEYKTQKTLRAFLGSCVGVVLIDNIAKIGGLLHILLPEPPAKAAVDEPEKYASTAVPLFIEAMTSKGATIENMVAFVAGGSLVGQVSMMDLKLDIGGKSAEIVEHYLKLENIKIDTVETGGYLSSQISLNLETLECEIKPILNIHTFIDEPENEQAQGIDIQAAINSVKPIPQIALKVIRMINSNVISMTTIAEEIRKDQIIAAKVLQLSNSAYVNPGKTIDSIDKALILLGEKRILLLTLSVFTEMFYQQADQGYSLIKGGLFRHSTEVSFISEKLALYTDKADADAAFTAGLLHDIGKTVLDQAMATDYPLFYRKMMGNSGANLIEIEKEMFGFNHNETGAKLSEKWALPAGLSEAISVHHTPERAVNEKELTHLIFLSDILAHSYSAGNSISSHFSGDMRETLNILNLTPAKITEFIDSIAWNEVNGMELI